MTTRIGERTGEPLQLFDHAEVVLEKTDETPSWAEGHADWHCLACGVRMPSVRRLESVPCSGRPA